MTAVLAGGQTVHPDPIKDDLSMVISSASGLIVVLGCAHAGMINVIDYTLSQFNADGIYAVIGGTHLGFATEDQFTETLKTLDRYRIGRLGVSHCTGLVQAAVLYHHMQNRFFFGSVGAVLEG